MVIALYHNYNTQALEKPTELARNKQTNKQTNFIKVLKCTTGSLVY